MLSAGRFVVILLILGAIAHFLLGGRLSFFTDYHIWGPAIGASRQEIILVHDVNSNYDRDPENSASGSGSATDKRTSGPSNDEATSGSASNKPNNGSANDNLTADKPTNTAALLNDKSTDSSIEDPFPSSSLAAAPTTSTNHSKSAATTQVLESTESLNNGTVPFTTTISGMQMIPQNGALVDCPERPPTLVGQIKVWFDEPSFEEMKRLYPYLEPGGHGKPTSCLARHRVAVVVPYRDREAHLRILLHNLHSLLTKQQLDYAIFIVEQHENETFNRAKLMNVGYAEAMKLYNWQCFIFHDVDLLPEDDRNIYSCPEQPRHMSVAIDKFQYKLPYGSIFGGISALKTEQFIKINGFSNDYWGWGGEDDDLSTRVTAAGYKIMRYPTEIARYKMIKHKAEKQNPLNKCRYDLMAKTKVRQQTDGLTSLKYERYHLELRPLFTHIKVKLLEQESKERLRNEGFKKC